MARLFTFVAAAVLAGLIAYIYTVAHGRECFHKHGARSLKWRAEFCGDRAPYSWHLLA